MTDINFYWFCLLIWQLMQKQKTENMDFLKCNWFGGRTEFSRSTRKTLVAVTIFKPQKKKIWQYGVHNYWTYSIRMSLNTHAHCRNRYSTTQIADHCKWIVIAVEVCCKAQAHERNQQILTSFRENLYYRILWDTCTCNDNVWGGSAKHSAMEMIRRWINMSRIVFVFCDRH